MLLRFPDAFSTGETELSRAVTVRHKIVTGADRRFRRELQRHLTAVLKAIDTHVDAILGETCAVYRV